jgi:AraC-like DNA-binding protein
VRCIWFLRGADPDPGPIVPDGRLEIILHRADPFLALGPGGTWQRQDAVLLSGQLSRPLHLVAGTVADVVGIRFRTTAARVLLALPLIEMRDQVIPLGSVDRALATELRDAACSPDPVTRISTTLLRRLGAHRLDARVGAAVQALDRGASVAGAARMVGMTVRTLERRVAIDVGLGPKLLQRVLRFRRFHALCQSGEPGARAAALVGYFDQSHADRDFKAFTGVSPSLHFGGERRLAHALLSDSS